MSEHRATTVADFHQAMKSFSESFSLATASFQRQMQVLSTAISTLNTSEQHIEVSWRYGDV